MEAIAGPLIGSVVGGVLGGDGGGEQVHHASKTGISANESANTVAPAFTFSRAT